jgi:uncharacterized protein (TIGR01777 family)
MKVLITGSSGLIGTALVDRLLDDGHEVVALVRRAPRPTTSPRLSEAGWDPATGGIDTGALGGVDAAVNLAGAGIGDHRWTEAYRRTILDSRVRSTELLARTIAGLDARPSTLVSGSAVGVYGDRGDELVDERSRPGTGFLADVCRAWEAATAPADDAGVRVVHARTGIVLSPRGGALRKQLPLFRLGLGGRFGSGRQWQSWISIDDEVRAIVHLLRSTVTGPVDLTAPNPVTNRELARALGAALHRPALLPVPAFAPKLLLGADLAESLLLHGQRVAPHVLESDGFVFEHATIGAALGAVLRRRAGRVNRR